MQQTNSLSSPQQKLLATLSQKPLKQLLEQKMDRIKIRDPKMAQGFITLPNSVMDDHGISLGARLTYGFLLRYAWQKGSCFPGQVTLGKDMGVSERQVRRYLMELKDARWLVIKRVNKRLNNLYILR